jgi:hypothetical protein
LRASGWMKRQNTIPNDSGSDHTSGLFCWWTLGIIIKHAVLLSEINFSGALLCPSLPKCSHLFALNVRNFHGKEWLLICLYISPRTINIFMRDIRTSQLFACCLQISTSRSGESFSSCFSHLNLRLTTFPLSSVLTFFKEIF